MRPTPIRNAQVPVPPESPVVSVSRKAHSEDGACGIGSAAGSAERDASRSVRQIGQRSDIGAAVPAMPLVQFFGFEVAAEFGLHLLARTTTPARVPVRLPGGAGRQLHRTRLNQARLRRARSHQNLPRNPQRWRIAPTSSGGRVPNLLVAVDWKRARCAAAVRRVAPVSRSFRLFALPVLS